MNALDYLAHGWNWNPVVLVGLAAAAVVYARVIGRRGRSVWFGVALTLVGVALLSPLNLLAAGVLFSAHMAQHIILLLLVPALVLVSLPVEMSSDDGGPAGRRTVPRTRWFSHAESGRRPDSTTPPAAATPRFALVAWALGVGSMWFWHVPEMCDAAAGIPSVHGLQTLSLLALGAAFWWPILAPRPTDRLPPGLGIAYLFTACLACTALGILLTLTPVDICPIFRSPTSAPALWANLRTRLTAARDEQIGGLLMWLPMCLVYLAGIVLELARWLGEPFPTPLATASDPRS